MPNESNVLPPPPHFPASLPQDSYSESRLTLAVNHSGSQAEQIKTFPVVPSLLSGTKPSEQQQQQWPT